MYTLKNPPPRALRDAKKEVRFVRKKSRGEGRECWFIKLSNINICNSEMYSSGVLCGFIFLMCNETCRNLQAKVVKTAAFCHNRALQDLYPTSYRLLFTTGSFTLTTSTFSNEPDVQRVQRVRMEG